MVPDISNTSQSLIINTYYIFECNEKDRISVNKQIEKNYSMSLIMNLMSKISKTLDTNICILLAIHSNLLASALHLLLSQMNRCLDHLG